MLAIPFGVTFTIYFGDMFKFFYFLVVPLVIVVVSFLFTKREGKVRTVLLTLFVFTTVLTAVINMLWNAFNENTAYTRSEVALGRWAREYTPTNSVFLTLDTLHSPVTQIGGRIRVLSYINWPHSHGYNIGEDNVFARLADVNAVYDPATSSESLQAILAKYKVSYVYYGHAERNRSADVEEVFNKTAFLQLVYERSIEDAVCGGRLGECDNTQSLKIYEYLGTL
jgi:uncharacterized membrane protein